MGISFPSLVYLVEKRLIERGSRILDIGSQNLLHITPENVVSFLRQFGRTISDAELKETSERLAYFSTVRANERTTYLSDLMELTDLGYMAYDVCPAPYTEIFDLNIQRLPPERRGAFDVVLNFGTTEHVMNQLNSFEVMHDAMKVGGVCFHQLPSIGYINHGYFNYNPLLIDDLVKANDYEVIDRFYTDAGGGPFAAAGVDIRDVQRPWLSRSATGPDQLRNFNINYILRKKVDAPFYVGLEIATTHTMLSRESSAAYGDRRRLAAGETIRTQSAIAATAAEIARAVAASEARRPINRLKSAIADGRVLGGIMRRLPFR
jgi:hypothetical protein